MTFTYNGVSSEVSITGDVNANLPVKTINSISGSFAGNSSVTLGTVPAGKRWIILNAQLSAQIGAGGAETNMQFNSVKFLVIRHQNGSSSVSQKWEYNQAPIITAGQTVRIVGDAYTGGTVQYIEENV